MLPLPVEEGEAAAVGEGEGQGDGDPLAEALSVGLFVVVTVGCMDAVSERVKVPVAQAD